MRVQPILVLLVLSATVLAGCSKGSDSTDDSGDAPGLDVTPTTGGIRGIVVDQAIVPVAEATVVISGGQNTTTDAEGLFNFTGLQPGDYLLSVGKPGFTGVQASATVVAGVAAPPIVKVLLERLSTAQPYLDFYKLDGFYECAHGLFFVTDTCDWVPRTAWDSYNESQGSPPPVVPRSALSYTNTQYVDVLPDTYVIVQEAFWTDENVKVLWVMMDQTPIDAGCDCSDSYSNVIQPSPTYNRVDRFDALGGNNTNFTADYVNGDLVGRFPAGESVAVRGFIPFQDAPVLDNTDPNTWYSVAQNFRFTIITSMFHNYSPPEGWTFETKDQFPVG
ncbi:MAG: carboxypeptidase-like regulatory domain-containing protein [Candidatus Thermoplasmatota archaeon]|jgi:hypothetical protein